MSGWTLASWVFLAGLVDIGLVAAEHLFRSPPSFKRRRERRLLVVVTGLAVLGFGLAHTQLGRNWGSPGAVANWTWLGYALVFSAVLWLVHAAFRRWRFDVDDVILAVVGAVMLLGLLNVWIWETRDANAFVSQVALPEMRQFQQQVTADPDLDLDPDRRDQILARLGPVPDELARAENAQPANVLHQEWVEEFNRARNRYLAAAELAPPSIPTVELRPVVVDNVFRRQLVATVLALAVIPGLSVAVFAASNRPWARQAGLVGASVLLVALGILAIAQGTFGRLPAFIQFGGLAVTVFSVSALVLVVALSTVANTPRHEPAYRIGGAVAIVVVTGAMVAIDTGAGLLLVLVVAATVVTRLDPPRRRLVYLGWFGSVLVLVQVAGADGVSFLPDRAESRLAAWTDPWSAHHQAEVENAGVRTVTALAEVGAAGQGQTLTAGRALALVDQELAWRLDSADGNPGDGSPVIPRTEAEERVLYQVELLWSDLRGYEIDPDDPEAPTLEIITGRVEAALEVVADAVDTAGGPDAGLAELAAIPRPDGLQYQRSLQALGAGGLFGVGLGNGRAESVPEVTEDMAVVFVGETFGFVGVMVTVGLVLLVAVRTIERAGVAPGPRADVVVGIGLLVGLQALVNLGGVTGAIPLTGIPFPFISRTGTGAVVLAVGVAMTLALTAGADPKVRSPLLVRLGGAGRSRWLRVDPLMLVAVPLLVNTMMVQVAGRQLAPGPVGAPVPRQDAHLLTASDPWARPDYRTTAGSVLDRNGVVLATNGGLGVRVYPDAELASSLSHSLTNLEWNLPLTEGGVGPTMVTTIDAEIQRSVHRAIDDVADGSSLIDARTVRGAVVVLDTVTGEVVAIESRPTFSLQELSDGEAWAVAEGRDRRAGFYSRHLHRALDGEYPPGSVFKLITASASLDYGFHRPGEEDFDYRTGPLSARPPDGDRFTGIWHQIDYGGGRAITDGHLSKLDEWVFDIEEALAYSSNVSFAIMANELGQDRLADTTVAFGFDRTYTIPYYGSFSSTLGVADENGERYLERGPWELGQTAVGQGETLVAPLQVALVTGSLVNDGVAMSPYVVSDLVHPDGTVEPVGRPRPLFDTGLQPATTEAMATMMAAVVDYGTAQDRSPNPAPPGERMAGKTGSAQWSDDLARTHALFTGFYPRSSPRLAIAVVVERGGAGGDVAASIARQVFASPGVAAYLETATPGENRSSPVGADTEPAARVASLVGERAPLDD